MSDKSEYYEYIPNQSKYWWKKTPPLRNFEFETRLKIAGGLNRFGEPNLRVVWAGDLMHEGLAAPTLKYKVVWKSIVGYNAVNPDGTIRRITKENPGEAGAIAVPIWETHELGRPRWAVEFWVSPEQLRAQKRFERTHDIHGQRIWRELPERGVYDHFFWIETAEKKFRDLDNEVCDAVIAMWRYNRDTSEAQKLADERQREAENARAISSIWTP